MIFIGLAVLILSNGCALSNQDLRDKFAAQGFETAERDLGVVVFFSGVLFEYDKYDLTPAAVSKVKTMAELLNDSRVVNRDLLLEGHTDSNGNDEYNQTLSLNRAQSVYNELAANKVRSCRMKVSGFGKSHPLAPNTNPDGTANLENQAKNRRVEIIIKNP